MEATARLSTNPVVHIRLRLVERSLSGSCLLLSGCGARRRTALHLQLRAPSLRHTQRPSNSRDRAHIMRSLVVRDELLVVKATKVKHSGGLLLLHLLLGSALPFRILSIASAEVVGDARARMRMPAHRKRRHPRVRRRRVSLCQVLAVLVVCARTSWNAEPCPARAQHAAHRWSRRRPRA